MLCDNDSFAEAMLLSCPSALVFMLLSVLYLLDGVLENWYLTPAELLPPKSKLLPACRFIDLLRLLYLPSVNV